jgi:hypothetical protein
LVGRALIGSALILAAATGVVMLHAAPGRADHSPAAACPEYETLHAADGFGGRFPEGRTAWSPRGRQIAVGGAKVVVVNVRTGRRSVVASIRSAALGLAWSPQGGHLAAYTENAIFIGAPPRRLRRFGRGCFGDWSPSGRRFAFTVGGWAQTANADGSQRRRVIRAASVTDWAPDGRRLLLLRFSAGDRCGSASRAYEFEFATRSVRRLTGNRTGGNANLERGDQVAAVFSPDGRRVSWAEGRPCGAGGIPEVEPVTHVSGGQGSLGVGYATWSPSSQLVALDRVWSHHGAAIVDLGGRVVRELPGSFSWSPDGSEIAFDAFAGDGHAVYVSPGEPSADRLLVRGGLGPAWSPDGSTIAFWRSTRSRPCRHELFVVGVRGGPPRKLLGC